MNSDHRRGNHTVGRSRLDTRVGVLDDASAVRLNRALVVFLGIAGST
jgi:hypothetical protein